MVTTVGEVSGICFNCLIVESNIKGGEKARKQSCFFVAGGVLGEVEIDQYKPGLVSARKRHCVLFDSRSDPPFLQIPNVTACAKTELGERSEIQVGVRCAHLVSKL